jgi:hypothetical protein
VLATALGWFIYDIGFYGSNSFIPTITSLVFGGDDDEVDVGSTAKLVNKKKTK